VERLQLQPGVFYAKDANFAEKIRHVSLLILVFAWNTSWKL
jgi:hypothetical protein